jgi:long-chain acyl-CoA synthetase
MVERIWLKHYEAGVPHDLEMPGKTIPLYLEETARRFPDVVAAKFMGGRLTYRELNNLAGCFAAVLAGMGIGRGSRVALNLPNCPQFMIAYSGILKAGAVVVPCNPLYVKRELSHQLNDSGAEVMVTLSRFYPLVRSVKEKTGIKTIIATNIKEYLPRHLRSLYTLFRETGEGDRAKLQPGDYWLQDLMKKYSSVPPPRAETELDDAACFLYTGGTTGLAKGAHLTHRNLVANALQIKSWLTDLKEGAEIGLAVLPFFHSYGMSTCLNLSLVAGGTLILVPRFSQEEILKLIHREKPTLVPGVPTLYIAMINAPNLQKYDLSSIRVCISGAAPLPLEVQNRFEALTGGRLREGYGLTETSPVTHCNPIYGCSKPGSIGIPFPGTEAKIVDLADPAIELPAGEIGQLAVRGPQVMKEYINQPEETAEVFHEDWFLTGDIGRMDEDGYFYIVDRKKDMIIAGGFNIFPREIEEVLFSHPKIKEACAAGIPHRYRGETVKAYIVLREGETMTEDEVIQFCLENMARYKVPKMIEFRDELPKTIVGKVLRRALVEEELTGENG